jgi:hypothetical protein
VLCCLRLGPLRILFEQVFGQERSGVGTHCSFSEVEGLFTVLMCTVAGPSGMPAHQRSLPTTTGSPL